MDRYHSSMRYNAPQIHAVPENERAQDPYNASKKLPWGYDTLTSTTVAAETRRELPEKGPFGRASARRRGTSRSRSKGPAEPQKREEDEARLERAKAEERIFGSLMRKLPRDESDASLPASHAAAGAVAEDSEPTEVVLSGYGYDLEWAAIDFYERLSGGDILEDYARSSDGQPSNYQSIARSYGRKSLSKAAMKKKNAFAGGQHWIKVTFGSRAAAELVLARSPRVIRGYLVSAELWTGKAPADGAVPVGDDGIAKPASDRDTRAAAMPASRMPTSAVPPWGATTSRTVQEPPPSTSISVTNTEQDAQLHRRQRSRPSSARNVSIGTGSLRIPGAKIMPLLPAEDALMPRQPRQGWFAWLFSEPIIGNTVPLREDGTFDFERASYYWRFWYWVDRLFGTEVCGCHSGQ